MPHTTAVPVTATGQPPSTGWLDPKLVQSLAPFVCGTVFLPADVVTVILPNDPDRVGFTVFKEATAANFPRVGPVPDVARFGQRESPDDDVRSYVLQDWLSFIIGEWFALSSVDQTVCVCVAKPRF